MAERWTISTLAREYGITLRTLRHYEELGLLFPERVGSARVYHQRDRIRLELILRGKRLGFSLGEIAVIVNMYDEPPGEAGQLEYLLEQCGVRRDALEQRRRDIDDTLRELDDVERRCRHDLGLLRSQGVTGVTGGSPGRRPPDETSTGRRRGGP